MPGVQSCPTRTSVDFCHGASRIPVAGSTRAGGCVTPAISSLRHTTLPPTPPYQPKRTASMWKLGAPVDTYRPTESPRCALTWSAQPDTFAQTASSSGGAQPGVPGFAFSATIGIWRGRVARRRGRAPAPVPRSDDGPCASENRSNHQRDPRWAPAPRDIARPIHHLVVDRRRSSRRGASRQPAWQSHTRSMELGVGAQLRDGSSK